MGKFCCFNCPALSHDNTIELENECPTCGCKYGFPLFDPPKKVGKYKIEKSLNRGFYGAVFKVKDEILDIDYVLKVIPKSIYKLINKDFYKECKEHAELAKNSLHIVKIIDASEELVTFGNGKEVDCFYSVLEYIPGKVLKEILESEEGINAIKIAQITINLFKILDVLKAKHKNHNDLHSENIIVQELIAEERRSGEVDNRIRVVAIDIGSLTTENKSGDSPDRQGDVHWVAKYLVKLSEKLIKKPEQISDQNYRLASLLEDRAKLLFPISENQRVPSFDEIIESVKNCFNQQAFPWEEPLRLLNFNDTYNAQTLDPWFVPSLLVDPDDHWLNTICGKGPLVITGMRGCGKTMMLRALQFHARATSAKILYKSDIGAQIDKLKKEGYIGLYISCNKLLDDIGKATSEPLHQPFSRLFIRYGIEAIKALRHLKSIEDSAVKIDYYKDILEIYSQHLSNSDLLFDVHDDLQLEQRLLKMIYSLNRGESKYIVEVNPASAFPALAQTIRNCSAVWANHTIFFLLDDVSTRYLKEENIRDLLSSLIFQSEECAFKITSEVQSIELILRSPGQIEKAKKGRDFETFDLGSAVSEKIRNKGGKQFVIDILNRRAKGSVKHPQKLPIEILGDTTLSNIAKNIVTRGNDKTLKKKIYHGISALMGVCIGDIGDMINLYDLIIRNFDEDKQICPIPAELQSECYQNLCSVRLYEINRRGSIYKDFAISFAEASHELLMKSAKDGSSRLRQYYSIYVRITTGDMDTQYQKVRELLDTGIFVYSGNSTPRTLGNDNNPINQFKLTFRKLYGISNLIGLSHGDRFELSGKQLEKWLENPSAGKEILKKNVGGTGSNVDEGDDIDKEVIFVENQLGDSFTQEKLDFNEEKKNEISYYESPEVVKIIKDKTPINSEVSFNDLKQEKFDLLVTSLGFEDRALYSASKLLELKPEKILLIQYKEKGKTKEILKAVKKSKIKYEIINYEDVKTSLDIPNGKILCDITGMSKSLIFNSVRNALKSNNNIWLSHIQAEKYYPLNEEIEEVLQEISDQKDIDKLETITQKINKGEKGPYEIYDLLFSDTDESKRNLLLSFANSKYERLFKIIEERPFDKIQIVSPANRSNRDKLSRLAAESIFKSYSNTEIQDCDSNDFNKTLTMLTRIYQEYYVDQNYNFEIALTGSKRNTVACAVMSASFKVSHCWYIKPSEWQITNYSSGIGAESYFKIELNS